MRRLVTGGLATLLLAMPVCAQTVFFDGTVGKAPVFGSLSRDGDNLIGWYLYPKHGKQIELQGKIDKSGAFHLDETSFDTAKKSGNFDGHLSVGVWSGTWKNASGDAPAPFALTENHDTLAKFSGDFRCSEKHSDKKYGYDYSRSARVTFAKGVVTRLDLSQESKGQDGDTQQCSIALSDLKRVPGKDGILLRAKGDEPGQDMAHCTIRVAGTANFLYVSPGDTAENNNDCKGANDVMFCSPRANWGDFLISRNSKICGPVD
ncbi:MAG TPA: hypothetical protein VIM56_11715 [Rhizomicrobium sp.]